MNTEPVQPTSAVRVFSPGYWRVVREGHSLRVIPTGFAGQMWFTAVVMAGLFFGVLLFPGIAFEMRVLFGFSSVAIGGTIVTLFGWLRGYQERQGPFLEISPAGLKPRGCENIHFAEFAGFDIVSRKEQLADSWQTVHLLVLTRNQAPPLEIVVCSGKRWIERLKRELDEYLQSVPVR